MRFVFDIGCWLRSKISNITRCRRTAKNTVEVSDDINELIIGVRNYLQDTCEPPCYVSDRRLLKAVDMLKVRLGSDVVKVKECAGAGKGGD